MNEIDRNLLRVEIHDFARCVAERDFAWRAHLRNLKSCAFRLLSSADLDVSTDWLAFTARDGYRYYASAVGLWRFSSRGESVDVDVWWVAFLNTVEWVRRADKLFRVMEVDHGHV